MTKLYNRIKSVFYIALIVLFAPLAKTVFMKRKAKGFDHENERRPSDAFVLHSLVFSSAGLEPKKLYKSLPSERNTKSEHVMQICSQLDQTGISDLGQASDDEVSSLLYSLRALEAKNYSGQSYQLAKQSGNYAEPTFFYDSAEIMRLPSIEELRQTMGCDEIARAYFGGDCEYLSANAWHTLASETSDNRSAQKFHFDLDSGWFIKFFCYLSNVDEMSGPFTYVTGSNNKKPRQFLSGMRINDAAVSRAYPDNVIQMVGEKGRFFVADTQGLHKGQHVQDGERILVQFLYAKEMFATNPSAIAR